MKDIEVIGDEQKSGEEPGAEIRARLYGFLDGMTLDYVWEDDGDNNFI